MMERNGKINRKTSETDVNLQFTLDGSGQSSCQTGIPFLDHMLDLFATHGLFELTVEANGDLDVDFHHTTEDIGICLGLAFKEALGDAKGIYRYASGAIPMDESLCQMAIDISNRPHLSFNADLAKGKVGDFDVELVEEFFNAFVSNARVSLHIDIVAGTNLHHMIEACFKAFGVILDRATRHDPLKKGVPSTKGIL